MDGKYRLLERLSHGPLRNDSFSGADRGYRRALMDARWISAGDELTYILDPGRAALASYQDGLREDARRRRVERIRYLLTLAISLASLVKSFWPEILGLLALLRQPPAQ